MKNLFSPLVAALLAAGAMSVPALAADAPAPATVAQLTTMEKRFAPVGLNADTGKLSKGDLVAIEKLIEYVRTFPCGPAEVFWLSYDPDNQKARKLYNGFGFMETGAMDGEEAIAALKL